MVPNGSKPEPKNWRDRWLVKNILAELPIIGGFFSKKTFIEATHDAGKCIFALTGGTTVMMSTFLRPTNDDPMAVQFLKMTTTMTIGMIAGKVTYNTVRSGGALLYQYCSRNTKKYSTIPQESPCIELRIASPADPTASTRIPANGHSLK